MIRLRLRWITQSSPEVYFKRLFIRNSLLNCLSKYFDSIITIIFKAKNVLVDKQLYTIEFGRLSKSILSCVTSWFISRTEPWRRRLIYGTLECSIVYMWANPFLGLWLVAGFGIDILVYKYQLQFSSGGLY